MKILKKEKNISGNSGQMMVEAMVALSVITVGILGVFTLTSRSIAYNRIAADRYVAVNLANEGIELTKNLIDRNIMTNNSWNYLPCNSGADCSASGNYEIDYNDAGLTSLNSTGRYLYFSKNGSGYYRYVEGSEQANTQFKRIITIDNKTPRHIKATSKVTWSSRGSSYNFSVEDDFYDLKTFKFNNNPALGT
jgi:Tfp pilus assembly protein PilV